MKKILVPTDYSALSLNALDFAIDLAKASGAQIDLVHFMETPIEAATFEQQLGADYASDFYDSAAIKGHANKLADIAKTKSGVKINTFVGGSGILSGAEKYVKSQVIDLIVIGADDHMETSDEFEGDVPEKLMEFLALPVISMREHVDYVSLTDIVLGINLNAEKYPKQSVPLVKSVAESFGAKIHLTNILPSLAKATPAEKEEGLTAFAKEAGFTNYDVKAIEGKDQMEGLLLYADQIGAGLIATISDAKPGLMKYFRDSWATDMVKASDMPVLVLNKRNL
jgi:nucleotide-binding universal stress UspA family protein